MVLNQTLGLNNLRQDLNRLFYSAPINAGAFAPNSLYAPNAFYGAHTWTSPVSFANQQQQPMMGQQVHFVPKANVAETPEASIVTVELPGVELSQVSLSIHGNALVLDGVRQPGGLLGDRMISYQVAEGRFGTFRWVCPIPNGTMASQIEASLRNGLLTIVLPRVNALTTAQPQVGIAALASQSTLSAAPVAQIVINQGQNA